MQSAYDRLVLLLFCIGCGSGPNQVEFVVPNGFQGDIILRHQPDAPELPLVSGRYVVEVPENGVLTFGGYWPFRSYLDTGRFANDDRLWVSKRYDDHPEKGQVGLYSGPSTMTWRTRSDENSGKGVPQEMPEYHWFVGTEEQWKSHHY